MEIASMSNDQNTLIYKAKERYGVGIADTNTGGYTFNNTSISAAVMQLQKTGGNNTICFNDPEGKEVGRMYFTAGELRFDGNANAAALVFMKWCRDHWGDLRDTDKVTVLQEALQEMRQETKCELYSEEEQIAIATCMDIVESIRNRHVTLTEATNYAQNLSRSMVDMKESLAANALNALAPEGTAP